MFWLICSHHFEYVVNMWPFFLPRFPLVQADFSRPGDGKSPGSSPSGPTQPRLRRCWPIRWAMVIHDLDGGPPWLRKPKNHHHWMIEWLVSIDSQILTAVELATQNVSFPFTNASPKGSQTGVIPFIFNQNIPIWIFSDSPSDLWRWPYGCFRKDMERYKSMFWSIF